MAGVRSDDSACSSVEAESAGSDFGSNAGCVAGTKFPGANRSVEQVHAGVNEVLQGSSEPPFRFHESVKKLSCSVDSSGLFMFLLFQRCLFRCFVVRWPDYSCQFFSLAFQ